jgi:adenosine deaminase
MQAHGMSISLNSDDPTVFHTSLAWHYRTALAKMKMSRYEVYQTNLHAFDAAFLPQDQKE